MRQARRWLTAVATIALAVVPASPAHADVDSVQSQATGVHVTGFLGSVGPVPAVAAAVDETSPPGPFGPLTDTSPGVSLPSFPSLFSTGPLAVATSGANVDGDNHAGFVEARAIAQNVNAGAGIATASLIGASCFAGADGSMGSTVIRDGLLNGQPFGNNPAPNTVVDVPGIGTVTLNEQVQADVAGRSMITVTAVHARYAGGAFGGIVPMGQEADAVIARVHCQASGPDVLTPPTTPTTVAPTSTTVAPVPTTAPAPTTARPSALPRLPETGSGSTLGAALLLLGLALALGRVRARRG